jgi:hypothetical protein
MDDYRVYDYKENLVDFTAVIKIPEGFIITSPRQYAIELNLDQSNLHETRITDMRPSTIYTDIGANKRCDNLKCFSKVLRLHLQGSIVYNAVVREFTTVKLVQGEPITAFTSNDTLAVDMNLGYGCYENEFTEDIPNQVTVDIIRHTEFVIDERGRKIPHLRKDSYPFFEVLNSGYCMRTICIPYTLAIEAKGFRDIRQ